MNKRLITVLILMLSAGCPAFADFTYMDTAELMGESFFTPPAVQNEILNKEGDASRTKTMPPLKRARLKIQQNRDLKRQNESQLAPVSPDATIFNQDSETSQYVSKETEENFDESMMPDGFEADEEAINENKKAKHFWNTNKKQKSVEQDDTESIVLDCDNVDYDTDKYCIYARNNVVVEFVKQQTKIYADLITFDRMNNTIKAEGNVKIVKNDRTITGDYIFVDMNEENALIENPITQDATIEIKSKKGYVYGDRIVQENGSINVNESFPINFQSATTGPQLQTMITPKYQTISSDMEKGLIRSKIKDIKITQKGDLEILALKKATLFKGQKKIIKIPALKVYTNKNHDYIETNAFELGSYYGLGMFAGPGFVFELPKGSVLKAMPILNYNHGIGVGAIGRFNSGTNFTQAGYGTAGSKILIRGKQKLDDNLFLQYVMNDYLDDWFLGRRRPKYGIDLVYDNSYSAKDFLLKGKVSSYAHRFDIGYFHDTDKDRMFDAAHGSPIGTMRARYMAQATQNFYSHYNTEKQTALMLDIVAQLSAAVYGTGDTQTIGRVGPIVHSQYKRWMQDLGYIQSVYDDNSPMPVYDAYRYGKSNIIIREYFRICRYLTIAWFGSANISGDSPSDHFLQENAFYISVGPDDFKFNIGYDVARENTTFTFQMMMDAKGSQIDYDKLEIKQDKKAKKDNDPVPVKQQNEFQNSEKAPVLQRAIVEDIKTVEDVL